MRIKTNSGFSLIEVVAAVGVGAIFALGMASTLAKNSRETQAQGEKLAQLETFQAVTQALGNPTICKNTLTVPANFGFDSTHLPATGGLPSGTIILGNGQTLLAVGHAANPTAPSLVVRSLDVVNIVGTGDSFTGQLQVTFDDSKLVRGLHPLLVTIQIQTDPTSPANSKKVISCSAGTNTANLNYEHSCMIYGGDKSLVYGTPTSEGINACSPVCNAGDGDLGLSGCKALGAGKYHSDVQCFRECAPGGPPVSGSIYYRHCGFGHGTNGAFDNQCTPKLCLSGDAKIAQNCVKNGTGYSDELIGSCTATCLVH